MSWLARFTMWATMLGMASGLALTDRDALAGLLVFAFNAAVCCLYWPRASVVVRVVRTPRGPVEVEQ